MVISTHCRPNIYATGRLNDLIALQSAALLSSLALAGLGCLPLFILPIQSRLDANGRLLRLLLCTALGGLLADVFLHILPEASAQYHALLPAHEADVVMGLWVLSGIIFFMIVEKVRLVI